MRQTLWSFHWTKTHQLRNLMNLQPIPPNTGMITCKSGLYGPKRGHLFPQHCWLDIRQCILTSLPSVPVKKNAHSIQYIPMLLPLCLLPVVVMAVGIRLLIKWASLRLRGLYLHPAMKSGGDWVGVWHPVLRSLQRTQRPYCLALHWFTFGTPIILAAVAEKKMFGLITRR